MTVITPHLNRLDETFDSIEDQGQRNTCLPISVTVAHQIMRGEGRELSAEALWQHAYAAGRTAPGGTNMAAMDVALREQGQPLDADWPYDGVATDPQTPPAGLSAPPWLTAEVQGRPPEHWDIIRALLAEQPVVVVMDLSQEFMAPQGDTILDPPKAAPSLGFHAVVAVQTGHDGSRYWVLLRNSWGSRWGQQGSAWVSEDHLAARMRSADVVAVLPDPSAT